MAQSFQFHPAFYHVQQREVGESLVSFYCEHDVIANIFRMNREVSDIIHPNSDERE